MYPTTKAQSTAERRASREHLSWIARLLVFSGDNGTRPERDSILHSSAPAFFNVRLIRIYRLAPLTTRWGPERVRLPRGAAICPAEPGMGREAVSVRPFKLVSMICRVGVSERAGMTIPSDRLSPIGSNASQSPTRQKYGIERHSHPQRTPPVSGLCGVLVE